MKTKNILLIIVSLFIAFSSVNAQYIEGENQVNEGNLKTTRTMSVTTTSAEPTLIDAEITTTSAEPVLYEETNENDNTEKYIWIAGIVLILFTSFILFSKKK